MQKLAGIITEGYMGQFYAPEYLEQKYGKAIARKIEAEIEEMDSNSWDRFTGMESAKEVEDYIADIKDMLELTEGYMGTDYGSSEDIALDMVKTGAGMPGVGLPEAKKKMTEKKLREMLKAQILKELEDTKSLEEAKKKKKEEEPAAEDTEMTDTFDVTADGEGAEVSFEDETDTGIGSSEMKKVSNKLTDAFEAAKEFGDDKLIQQVANTIKYFNDNIVLAK